MQLGTKEIRATFEFQVFGDVPFFNSFRPRHRLVLFF